jgi:hypothetical protein
VKEENTSSNKPFNSVGFNQSFVFEHAEGLLIVVSIFQNNNVEFELVAKECGRILAVYTFKGRELFFFGEEFLRITFCF